MRVRITMTSVCMCIDDILRSQSRHPPHAFMRHRTLKLWRSDDPFRVLHEFTCLNLSCVL